jgi:hypothetical protein
MRIDVSFETFCNYDIEIGENEITVTDRWGNSKSAKLGETVEFRGGDDCFTPYEGEAEK